MSILTKEKSNERWECKSSDFLRLSGLTTAGLLAADGGAAGDAPAADGGADSGGDSGGAATSSDASAAAGSSLADVTREKTLILMFGGDGTQVTDVGLGNPYAAGASHQMGARPCGREPLAFYSAFADETIPWLATNWSYNDDFTELTINIREGVSWSDGTPFTANDVAFTLNMFATTHRQFDAPRLCNRLFKKPMRWTI